MSNEFIWGTGKRKSSIARVRINQGKGDIVVNNKKIEEYLTSSVNLQESLTALELLDMKDKLDIFINVNGGGISGQSGAIKYGIAKAILNMFPEKRKELKEAKLLVRDARVKERKKYGLKKARKAPQFSKR